MALLEIIVFFTFSLLLVLTGAEGGSRSKIFKTIKTEHGDVYDCIDINKQPSLQHPALRDHKVQVRPPSSSGVSHHVMTVRNRTSEVGIKVKLGLKQDCPPGSVPIRRRKSQNSTYAPLNIAEPEGSDIAGLFTTGGQLYRGAHGLYSVWNPKVFQPDQRTAAILSLMSVSGDTFNVLTVGWTVAPALYKDTRTRLFMHWTADGFRNTGCFNLDCQGFVVTSTSLPLDYAFPEMSTAERDVAVSFYIYQIPILGSYHLVVGDQELGYWPGKIFTTEAYGVQMIRWGGLTAKPSGGKNPPMGSGSFDFADYEDTAYVKEIKVVKDGDGHVVDPDADAVELVNSRCYAAGDYSFKGSEEGYSFVYGNDACIWSQDP